MQKILHKSWRLCFFPLESCCDMLLYKPSLIFSLVAVVCLIGCAPVEKLHPVPAASQGDSLIGIAISLRPLLPLRNYPAEKVYFALVDDNGSLMQNLVLESSFSRSGRVYLANAKPGNYVAVAATFRYKDINGPEFLYIIYFSKSVVEASRQKICINSFAFMGSHVLVMKPWWLIGADDVQRHYQKLMFPKDIVGSLFQYPATHLHFCGEVYSTIHDEESRTVFMGAARSDLAGTDWLSLLVPVH